MNRHSKGFTLIELLVVMVIIAVLASLIVVLIKGVIDRARNSKTHAFVRSLDQMCHSYAKDHAGTFPPAAPYSGSQNLHFYLGRNRIQVTQYDNSGTPVATEEHKPYHDFGRDQLQGAPGNTYPTPPVPLIDAWGYVIQYLNPGTNIPDGVDIWSMGKNGVTDASPTGGDDIGNWIRDF